MPKRKRKKTCARWDCPRVVEFAGFCDEHEREEQRKERRRARGLEALHRSSIDGRAPEKLELRAELRRLQGWFQEAHEVDCSERSTARMPADEARFAVFWCIELAADIADAEELHRASRAPDDFLEYKRAEQWERFQNLERGLSSNGMPRREEPQPARRSARR